MPIRTVFEKKEYHRKYYQDNIDHLQTLARIRYWALECNIKSQVVKDRRRRKKRERTRIIKGTFVLNFD